ncbi:MAG: hypothetical protein DMF90_21725, partial [Acidobacteria bacterium]
MSAVALPADRRFRRALVKPAGKRERWRRRVARALKVGLLALLAAVTVSRGRDWVAEVRALQISRVVVRGNHYLSSADVLDTLKGLRGASIVTADLDVWRHRVLESPWVADAVFRRTLPSTVEVTLTEREPIAVGRLGTTLYLIDGRGMVIDLFGPQHGDLDLPIVDGLGTTLSAAAPDEVRAGLAARLLLAFRTKPDLARRVSQVNVTNPHNAGVILNGDRAMLYVGEDRFLPRVEAYLGLASALREQVSDIDYVDLRFE